MLLQKLREESRAVFLQRKSRELLDNEELQVKDDKSVHLLLYPKDFFWMLNADPINYEIHSLCRACGFCWISTRCHL